MVKGTEFGNCTLIYIMILCILAIQRCGNDALSVIFGFSLTHDNFNEDNTEKEDVAVGGSVNIYCNQGNKRIVEDKWDEGKGPSINYVGKILPIFAPLPPP